MKKLIFTAVLIGIVSGMINASEDKRFDELETRLNKLEAKVASIKSCNCKAMMQK